MILLVLLQEITISSTWENCKHLVERSHEYRYFKYIFLQENGYLVNQNWTQTNKNSLASNHLFPWNLALAV